MNIFCFQLNVMISNFSINFTNRIIFIELRCNEKNCNLRRNRMKCLVREKKSNLDEKLYSKRRSERRSFAFFIHYLYLQVH